MINAYNDTHEGCLPVRVLQHNILAAFENADPNFIEYSRNIIREKDLDPEIGFIINESATKGLRIIGPHVVIQERKIYLDETFLSYLWCFCYSLFIHSKSYVPCTSNLDITRANALIDYAIRLKSNYEYWDKSVLINPELYKEEDQYDIEMANAIFQHACVFILCHEFFHIESGHMDSDIYQYRKLSLEMAKEKLENENEADKKAVNLMLSGCNEGNERAVKFGITTALCGLMFLQNRLGRDTHPDTDNRIIEALDGLELDENDACWLVACASLGLWQKLYGIEVNWEDSGSFKETFVHVSRQCD